MQPKTLRKILRRFERLPLHHIDTSVILEPDSTEDEINCRKYLQKVGYNYTGKFSFPVLSELFLTILQLKNSVDKQDLLDFIDHIVSARKITFCSSEEICEIMKKIEEIDSRIENMDKEIVACAVKDKSSVIVTLDKKLLHNERLENEFGVKIKHPKELL